MKGLGHSISGPAAALRPLAHQPRATPGEQGPFTVSTPGVLTAAAEGPSLVGGLWSPGHGRPLWHVFFVLDALLSVVNLCELEFAVHLAAGDRPGLLSCGLWQQLYYSKQGPCVTEAWG